MAHNFYLYNPYGFPMQNVYQPFVEIPLPPPLNLQLFGGVPMAVSVQKTVEVVGTVILTKSSRTLGQYDLLMCHSERKAYEAFGGDIKYGTSPSDCMNSLLGKIGLHVKESTQYIDIENHMTGKVCRIYILYIPNTSCISFTQAIQADHVISRAFNHFIRIPVNNILHDSNTIRDNKGVYRELTSFSRDIALNIAKKYRDFI